MQCLFSRTANLELSSMPVENRVPLFETSKALTEDGKQFVGLALDEDSQYELSDERIATWVEQVMTEYAETL